MTDHALLLVNLGSPASTSVADVRRYLNQFLMDPYVVDLPWPVRRLLVSLILVKRPEQSAHAYASIWWEEGSPLVVLTRRLQAAMVEHWPHGPVEIAMRYGQPALPDVLARLAAQGVRKVTLAPLYPQFADSTVTTVVEQAKQTVSERQLPLQMRVLQPFYEHPAVPGAGLRPPAAELSWLAGTAPEEAVSEGGQARPACCRLLPRCTCRSTFGLLSRAMPGYGQGLCAAHGHT